MSTFRLDELGWWEFERLCQALLTSAHGVAIESWGGSGDGGRDAYSQGPLAFPEPGESQAGPFIFQAKFVEQANAAGADVAPALRKAVSAELKRIEERRNANRWEAPGCYALLTNAPLSASLRDDLRSRLEGGLPGARVVLCGEGELSAMLASAPEGIRTTFPQLLGIQDLQALIQKAVGRDAAVRGDLIMQEAAELAPRFVPTNAYGEALSVLAKHGFVVLTGPPEMGKTTIALMIALARLSAGWEVYDCSGPSDLFKVHNSDANQVFLADDAFGSTEYTPDRALRWAEDLHKVLRAVDSSHWLLWTSRPAPLKLGLRQLQLQGGAERFPDPG